MPFSISNSSSFSRTYSEMAKRQIPYDNSVIARNTVFVGNIATAGTVTILGKVEGNIQAGSLIIEGCVDGDIWVKELLELKETGTVNGQIITHLLSVADGGVFNGQCMISASL